MYFNIYVFLCLSVIFCITYNTPAADAMVGSEVRRVPPNEYSFIVSIMHLDFTDHDPVRDHVCTGVLISRSHVLTAAHCIEYRLINQTMIAAGSNNLILARGYAIRWWITYNTWMAYRQRPMRFESNDLSIIKLVMEVDYDIPHTYTSDAESHELWGHNAFLTGWGIMNDGFVSPNLLKSRVRILSNAECTERVERLAGQFVGISFRYLCTASEPYSLLHEGDFGGPLMFLNQVIGINQNTIPIPEIPEHPEKVNLHVGVYYYRRFITDVSRNDFMWSS